MRRIKKEIKIIKKIVKRDDKKYNDMIPLKIENNKKKLTELVNEKKSEKIYFFYTSNGEIKKPSELFKEENISRYTLAEIIIDEQKELKIEKLYSILVEKESPSTIQSKIKELENEEEISKKIFFYKKISLPRENGEIYGDLHIKKSIKEYNFTIQKKIQKK
jgi:hypothetical protein